MSICSVPKKFVVLLAVSFFAFTAFAASAARAEEEKEQGGGFEKFQEEMSGFVLDSADRLDRFFGSERYYTYEENRTRLKLLLDVDHISGHGTEVTPRVRLHLVLPRFENRFRLIFNETDDDGSASMQENIDDDANLALRWIGRQTDELNLSFDVGLRYRDKDLSSFGRINTQLEYPFGGIWNARSTVQLYWYTDTGWRVDGRQYFERNLSDRFFFRSRTRLQWFDEEDGIFPEQSFGLYQRLRGNHAIVYEAIARVIPEDDTFFDSDDILNLDDQYTRYLLRARYRVNVWKPWLFFEFWPTLIFAEERDYETDWGGRLRAEIYFGYVPRTSKYLKEE